MAVTTRVRVVWPTRFMVTRLSGSSLTATGVSWSCAESATGICTGAADGAAGSQSRAAACLPVANRGGRGGGVCACPADDTQESADS